MATTRVEIASTDGWVKLADATDAEFLIENLTAIEVFAAFSDAVPAADSTAHHRLKRGEGLIRVVPGHVYARIDYEGASAALAVSV